MISCGICRKLQLGGQLSRMIVGDGSPVPQPVVYGFADNDANMPPITAGTGNPSPTMAMVSRMPNYNQTNTPSGS